MRLDIWPSSKKNLAFLKEQDALSKRVVYHD